MTRLRLVCFGKPAPKALEPALKEYADRLARWCRLEIVELPEEKGGPDPLRREAEIVARRLEGFRPWIALDPRGEAWSSERWASELETWRRESPAVGLVVGSADGLHPELLAKCRKVSLGPVTLPHTLARLVLLEQVYRAHTQVLGLPYHLGH